MVFMIDNYDSFTYNVAQYLGELGHPPEVLRNDKITLDELKKKKIRALVVSPGPGDPSDAGVSLEAVKHFADEGVPVLGICLGHQCVGVAFGGRIIHAPRLMHGKVSEISHDGSGIFKGIPDRFSATRYHSLVIDPATLPSELEATAEADDGSIMGVAHKSLPVHGVQFHPESIITEHGHKLLANFLELAGLR
jgi:anthranilate synthase component 2